MSEDKRDELERVEELFAFLQGQMPDDTHVAKSHRPKLSADQAWTVIWYLGNEYWQVPDYIERCDLCGELFNSEAGGACLDYGKAPYHFCDNCICTPEFERKNARNPDKNMREAYSRSIR